MDVTHIEIQIGNNFCEFLHVAQALSARFLDKHSGPVFSLHLRARLDDLDVEAAFLDRKSSGWPGDSPAKVSGGLSSLNLIQT